MLQSSQTSKNLVHFFFAQRATSKVGIINFASFIFIQSFVSEKREMS